MVCALVRGSARKVGRRWQGQKPLIFMHFHEVSFGSQHEIWSKQHNGKVRSVRNRGVSQIMPFLVIPRSKLRGGFIPLLQQVTYIEGLLDVGLLNGPAGAFKQEITVLHNALSNSGLCGGACERQQNRENDARGIE